MKVERLSKKISKVSLLSGGLYLRLCVVAAEKTGDGIEDGRIEIGGVEPSAAALAALWNVKEVDITTGIKELVEVGLVGVRPLRILDWVDDHAPYLRRRRFCRERSTERSTENSTDLGTEVSAGIGQDRIGKDRIGRVYDRYREKIQPNSKPLEKHFKKIAARLKTFSEEELFQAIDRFSENGWWMRNNAKRGASWFFESDDRIEKSMNIEPEKEKFDPDKRPRKIEVPGGVV